MRIENIYGNILTFLREYGIGIFHEKYRNIVPSLLMTYDIFDQNKLPIEVNQLNIKFTRTCKFKFIRNKISDRLLKALYL